MISRISLIQSLFCIGLLLSSSACKTENKAINTKDKNIDALLKKYPDSISLLLQRSNIYLDSLDFALAFSDVTRAYRLDSNRLESQQLYAKILNNAPNRNLRDINIAQKLYHKVLKKKPRDTEVLVELASTYAFQQDFERSFEYLDDALRVDPKCRNAYFKKGTNFLEMNRIDLAKSSYETATQQDPKFWEAYIILGDLYLAEENKIAIEYFKTARDLQPSLVETAYRLAYAYQMFGDVDAAQETYREMYALNKENAMPDFQIGYMKQFMTEEIDSAIYYYNEAIKLEPQFVEAWHNLGMCYEDKKDKTNALKCYSKALKYNPDFTKSREAADKLK